MNYINLFFQNALKFKNNIALISPVLQDGHLVGEKTMSYSEVIDSAILVSNNLRYYFRGKTQKRIGLMIGNHQCFVQGFLGILAYSAVIMAIDPKMERSKLSLLIRNSSLEVIVTKKELASKLANLQIDVIFVEDLCEKQELWRKEIPICKKKEDDEIIISYTSGTSGSSKGVLVTNKNTVFVSRKYGELYHLGQQDIVLGALPLWHNYGMFACMTGTLLTGGTIILMEEWSPEIALKLIEHYRLSVFPASPFMYVEMVVSNIKNYNLDSLKICDSGGDAISIESIRRFEESAGVHITEGYGLTETTSLTHFNVSVEERRFGSIGKRIPEAMCKITDLDGKELPLGEYGLLWIKGPMVTKGYDVLSELTAKKYLSDGWFNTEDIVRCDKEGYFYIAGRYSDIQTLKMNVFPRDIQERLFRFPGVKKAHVVKEYSPVAGCYLHDLHVVLVSKQMMLEKFLDFTQENFKDIIIRELKIWDEIPITSTGKVMREQAVI